jgi:hypothetical protein
MYVLEMYIEHSDSDRYRLNIAIQSVSFYWLSTFF